MNVQYGSGFCSPPEWENFDVSPTLRFERIPVLGKLYSKNEARFPEKTRYGDIVAGLPLPNGSCDHVYCSHVLEHLSFRDFHLALDNTLRLLKPGGVFRLVVPDLEYSISKYLASSSPTPAVEFQQETLLGVENRPRGIVGFIGEYLGNSRHLWMWDYRSLKHELSRHGFSDVRRAVFGDSVYPVYQAVEEGHRWRNALGIECRK